MQEDLSQVFERFAEEEFHNSSPLYEDLSRAIAKDPEVLSLAAHCRKGERVPNLLFAAVHFLLLKGVQHPLSLYYKDFPTSYERSDDPYPTFRSFCLEHSEEIRCLISSRMVQTNEVSRCSCLVPAFVLVSQRSEGRPLYFVEIGASAGLNLLWDHYRYTYGETLHCGGIDSPVQIKCVTRGTSVPPLPAKFPQISARVGIDLNPIDVRDSEAVLWLRALIWPEHLERADLLLRAIQVARQNPPTMIKGDAVESLSTVIEAVPDGSVLCIVRIFTPIPSVSRDRFSSLISAYGANRDVFTVSSRPRGRDESELVLRSFVNGIGAEKCVAYFQNHGAWIEWLEAERDCKP
jgi:hypothetical protein